MIRTAFLLAAAMLLSTPNSRANIFYVNHAASGNNDGTSWEDALNDLQDALSLSTWGDEIWVAKGTYHPTNTTNKEISFEIKDGVSLYGGFLGNETLLNQRDWAFHETILSGDIGVPDFHEDNSFNVVFAQNFNHIRLDGFTITRGRAVYQNSQEPFGSRRKNGGACFFKGSGSGNHANPVIHNCRFWRNYADWNGGSIFIEALNGGSSVPDISSCAFENNGSGGNGGGIYFRGGGISTTATRLEDCTFLNHGSGFFGGAIYIENLHGQSDWSVKNCEFAFSLTAFLGGAIYYDDHNPDNKLIVDSCLFYHSRAYSEGGAIWSFSYDNSLSQVIKNSRFINNRGGYFPENDPVEEWAGLGGAIYLQYLALDSLVTVKIDNCSFEGNSSLHGGDIAAGGCNLRFTNSLFAGNSAKYDGGALHVTDDGLGQSSKFFNCTFVNNVADSLGGAFRSVKNFSGGGTPLFDFKNGLFYGNTARTGGIGCVSNTNVLFTTCSVDQPLCDSLVTGYPPSVGNIWSVTCLQNMLYDQYPAFTDTAAGDYSLHPCSPARNAGSNAIANQAGLFTDLAGNPRILEGTVDMGAYETPAFAFSADTVLAAPCAGGSGSVHLNLQHGCPPFQIEWQGGSVSTDTAFVILEEDLPAGSHSITVTDSRGFSDTLEASISEPPALLASAAATPVQCGSAVGGSASASGQGGTGDYAYLWSNQAAGQSAASLPVGTYAVTLTDANGCTAVASAEVQAQGHLSLGLDLSPVNCHDSFDGTAAVTPLDGLPPHAYAWQSGQSDSLIAGLGGGSYAVTVTDALGCTDVLSFSMPAPTALQFSITASPACFGEANGTTSIEVSGGTPGYEFHWDSGSMTSHAENLAPGWHTVTVTDMNDCSDTTGAFVPEAPQVFLAVQATEQLCFGGMNGTAEAVASGGVPPYNFLWGNASADSLLTGLPPDNYAVTLTDANECTQTASAVIAAGTEITLSSEAVPATGAALSDGSVQVQQVNGGEPGYAFLWSNGATTQNLENVLPGDYSLTVTDADSCSQAFSFTVSFEDAANEKTAGGFTALIVPNPSGAGTAAQLEIQSERQFKLEMRLSDALGKVLLVRELEAQPGLTRSALPAGLAAGAYWVRLSDGNRQASLCWVVE